jgi:hypothetical protein
MDQVITDNPLANELMVSIIDADRAVHDAMPAGMADTILAALAAEPETLEELQTAVARYDRHIVREGFLQALAEGVNEETWDAGVMIIDLPARLVVADTEPALYQPAPHGYALYVPDPPPDDWLQIPDDEVVWVRYELPGDWRFVNSLAGWRELAAERRRDRGANPPFDARPILFGRPVVEFIARECLAARGLDVEDSITEIHVRWLMTPRDDLRGQTPREVLLAKHEFMDADLQWRANQWSFSGEAPLELSRESAAYRFAAFGTHGNVVNFDLLQYLIKECLDRVNTREEAVVLEDEIARLERFKEEWLENAAEYTYSPARVLEQERRRIPFAVSAHDAVIDHDCPMCQMALDPLLDGPTFWHLDGSHMDLYDNWVFSFHPTREAWEAERREWEEESRRFKERQEQRRAEGKSFNGRDWVLTEDRVFSDEARNGHSSKADGDDDDFPF